VDYFLADFFDVPAQERIDREYFSQVYQGVQEKTGYLLAIIRRFAPKFSIDMMPPANIIPLLIALYEMHFFVGEPIPPLVSINEAIEITKKFSDDSARVMVNAVLNAAKNLTQDEILLLPLVQDHFFQKEFSQTTP
jgi:N utilization substance protein B